MLVQISKSCPDCDGKFESKKSLKCHKKSVHKRCVRSCGECGKECVNQKSLLNHMRLHKEKIECNICGKIISQGYMKTHLQNCLLEPKSPKSKSKSQYPKSKFTQKSSQENNTMFRCTECEYSTRDKSNLKKHVRNVHLTMKYNCDFCAKKFNNVDLFQNHIKVHETKMNKEEEIVWFECSICDFKSKRKNNLKRHKERHEKTKVKVQKPSKGRFKNYGSYTEYNEDVEKKWKCKLCDFSSSRNWSLLKHIDSLHFNTGSISCDICGKVVKHHYITKHISLYHTTKDGHSKCEKCLKDIPSENFNDHQCEMIACDQCGKLFPRKGLLLTHVRLVHATECHSCSVCGNIFTSKERLKHHLKSHEDKKPCPECGVLVRNIKEHIQRSHTKDELKKHQCQDCEKGFICKQSLETHRMNVHLKLRPFKCRYGCEFGYNDPANRNSHERKKHGKIYMVGGTKEEIAIVMEEVKVDEQALLLDKLS